MEALEDVLQLPSVSFEERKELPNSNGLYFVVAEDKMLVYIGMTVSSFLKRWRDHSVARAIKQILIYAPDRGWSSPKFKIYYLEMPNAKREEIYAQEQHLINNVFSRPVWNQKSGGIKIELVMEVFATCEHTIVKSDFQLAYDAHWQYIHECSAKGIPYEIDQRYSLF